MTTPNQNLLPAVREPDNYTLTDVEKVGTWIARSGMFGCTKPEQGQVIALACREKGMNLFEFLDRYHVMFDGKIKLKSHAVHADFRRAGGKVVWIKSGDDGKVAEADVTFEGQTVRLSYTIEQAVKQQLVKRDGNWEKTPGNMLRARLITNAVGMLCPEIYMSGGDDEGPTPAPLSLGTHQPTVEIITYDTADAKQVMAEAVGAAIETASQPTVDVTASLEKMNDQLRQIKTEAEAVVSSLKNPDDSNPELQPVEQPSAAKRFLQKKNDEIIKAHDEALAPASVVIPSASVLPDELLTKLATLLAGIELESAAFCRSINWIKEGETMANLSVANAKYICAKHESFAAKAKAFATKA